MGTNAIFVKAVDKSDQRPGTWHRVQTVQVGTHLEGINVYAYCPDCGRRCGLHSTHGRSHAIRGDGVVHPSMICPHAGCDYHEFVTLDGWTHGSLPMHDGET